MPRRPSSPLTHRSKNKTVKNNTSRAKFSRKDVERLDEQQAEKRTSRRTSRPERPGRRPDAPVSAPKRKPSKPTGRLEAIIRLNKFLADAGIASRRTSDELISTGVVKINGKVVKELGTKVHPSDLVTVNGEPVSYIKHLTYVILNKPKDYITTTSDDLGRKTVMDLIPISQRLYPVGRLDRNTTGVLIITNDGELATRLMHPKYGVEREYSVGLDKKLKFDDAKAISEGVELEDGVTGPAEVFIERDQHECKIVLREGKNREVRRLFEHFGYEVERLHRVRYAGVTVTGLSRGEYRHLTPSEVRNLRSLVGLE